MQLQALNARLSFCFSTNSRNSMNQHNTRKNAIETISQLIFSFQRYFRARGLYSIIKPGRHVENLRGRNFTVKLNRLKLDRVTQFSGRRMSDVNVSQMASILTHEERAQGPTAVVRSGSCCGFGLQTETSLRCCVGMAHLTADDVSRSQCPTEQVPAHIAFDR